MKMLTERYGLSLLLTIVLGAPLPLAAQVPVDEHGDPLAAYDDGEYASKGIAGASVEPVIFLSGAELEELVGPVALYPDDLLAIVLPASTYPLEIVQAARFLDELETDDSLEPDADWDDSVVALLNYPEVVRMMNEEIDWTWRLGDAVVNQQPDVIGAVEAFRDRAYAAGNLESDEYQTVKSENGSIEIAPVDDDVIYVPYYEPEEVIVYQTEPVYAYYPEPRPVYYYPYPVEYAFPYRHFWGVTTAFSIGWPNRYLNVYHPTYYGHPYYGRSYYGHYYRQPSITVYNTWYSHNNYRQSDYRHRNGDYWRPRHRNSGARPANRSVRNLHNPPSGSDRNRFDERSNRRTPNDTQFANRDSARQSGATNRGVGNRRAITSDAGQRAEQRSQTRTGNREQSRSTGRKQEDSAREFRFRDRSTDKAVRGNRNGSSGRERADTTRAIRFRDRSGNENVQVQRNGDSARSTRSGNREQATSGNFRAGTAVRKTAPATRSGRRTTAPTTERKVTTARTSRGKTNQVAAARRTSSRPVEQRQARSTKANSAAAQRTSSRTAARSQAPNRQTTRTSTNRQPAQSNRRQTSSRANGSASARQKPAAQPQRNKPSSSNRQRSSRSTNRQRRQQ